MAVAGAIIVAAVAAIAAGGSAYMQSENAAAQARDARKRADWQRTVEEQQAEAARKQARMKAQRHLNAQAAKAGGAGVVAGEGSLLVDQLEAASMAQYEEDLAAYGHQLGAQGHGFESKLFKTQESRITGTMPYAVGLSAGSAAASNYPRSNTGTTVATKAYYEQGSDYGGMYY
jgi:hypothetical protein